MPKKFATVVTRTEVVNDYLILKNFFFEISGTIMHINISPLTDSAKK